MEKCSFEVPVVELLKLIQQREKNITGIWIQFEDDGAQKSLSLAGVQGREIDLKQPFLIIKPIGKDDKTQL